MTTTDKPDVVQPPASHNEELVPGRELDALVGGAARKGWDALRQERPEWASNIILAGLRGSDAHGTKLPEGHPRHTDDTDTFGVAVHPTDWYLGLGGYSQPKRKLSWDTAGEHYDHLVHDVRKFFHLLCKGNPNVHNWLWADASDIGHSTMAGRLILLNRGLFLSRHCFNALAGYAHAQMHKMERKKYAGYQGAKRKKLVDEIGYDVKHAAHCVRLLKMGLELAAEGRMSTRRPDDEAAMLRDIKAGEWSFRRTRLYTDDLFKRFREAEAAADLPDEVDRDKVNGVLVQVIHMANREPGYHEEDER